MNLVADEGFPVQNLHILPMPAWFPLGALVSSRRSKKCRLSQLDNYAKLPICVRMNGCYLCVNPEMDWHLGLGCTLMDKRFRWVDDMV